MENYAGADLHKKVTQLAVLRERKPPSQYRFSNDPHTVEEILKRLPSGERPARPRIWWGVSPHAVNCPIRAASISDVRGGNKP